MLGKAAISGVVAIFLFGCTKNERSSFIRPPEWSDPYLQAFRGKNIRYAIIENKGDDTRPDTIEFDHDGNIIRTMKPWSERRFNYDSGGFKVMDWQISCTNRCFKIQYSMRGDTLISGWSEYRQWSPKNTNDTSTFYLSDSDAWRFDKEGRVIENIGRSSKYFYEGEKLTRIHEASGSRDGWYYTYDNNILKSAMRVFLGYDFGCYFYTNGLLDSSWVKHNPEFPEADCFQYRYIYY